MNINQILLKLLFFIGIIYSFIHSEKADLIVFSFDRPLQLHALLESITKYTKNIDKIFIIYRTSNERYLKAYSNCFNNFKNLNLEVLHQEIIPKNNFKMLLLSCLDRCKKYFLFSVDDIIIKDYFDIDECIKYLQKSNIYAFYLRLGKNINECFTEMVKTPVPNYQIIDNKILYFNFDIGKGDWGYPASIDFTLFKKNKIIKVLKDLTFHSPNTFESAWAGKCFKKKLFGICYFDSKVVNIPANIVQNDFNNRNMQVDPIYFLEIYEKGFKIDIDRFHKINNKSPHIQSIFNFKPI